MRTFILALISLFVLATEFPHDVLAKPPAPWPVKGRLLGKHGKKSIDISGIACSVSQGFPRSCLVIDDNPQEAQRITLHDGRIVAGKMIPLTTDTYKGKPLELDGEGVAYASGYYYVIGSHGHPRDTGRKLDPIKDASRISARIAASSEIVRIAVDVDPPSVTSTGKLREIIAADPVLRPFLDRRLENNGLTIEGVAAKGGRLFAGFRSPSLENGRAAILSVSLGALFGTDSPDPKLYRLPLGEAQGVRDLAPYGGGILVLSGPAADGGGAYAIYWWDGASESVRRLRDLADVVGKKGKCKAEALLPLDESRSGLRALILFDGEKEGHPVSVEMPWP